MARAMVAHDTGLAANRQTTAVLTLAVLCLGWAPSQERVPVTVKSPMVLVVGCAATTAEPHVWLLAHAGEPAQSATVGITSVEKQELKKRSLGRETYHLIGVADFVDAATARRIGDRGKILSPPRVNATGMLAIGHKVAVKGLYIEARPPRINLTAVASLSSTCP
ncbi:MAG: hypothetical protein ACRD2N_24225 [Vicinamibacterales bacterium]